MPKYRLEMGATPAADTHAYLYDVIDSYGCQELMQALRNVAGPLTIHLNSPGGDLFMGMALGANLARRTNCTVLVEGLAASAASVIAAMAPRTVFAPGAYMMIHAPWTMAAGDAAEFAKTSDTLAKMQENLAATYAAAAARRLGDQAPDDAAFAAMIAEETWLDGLEAVALGLGDAIEEGMAVAACAVPADFAKAPPGARALFSTTTANQEHTPMTPAELLAVEAKDKEIATLKAALAAKVKAEEESAAEEKREAEEKKKKEEAAAKAKAEADEKDKAAKALAEKDAKILALEKKIAATAGGGMNDGEGNAPTASAREEFTALCAKVGYLKACKERPDLKAALVGPGAMEHMKGAFAAAKAIKQ